MFLMRDIERRIQRRRLSRYGASTRTFQWPWVWAALGLWLVWATFLSDHSFYQLWRLEHANSTEQTRLAHLTASLEDVDRRTRDPRARLDAAEHEIRENEGRARPGELIYRIEDADSSTPSR
jgi:cell division protein FtsB